MIEATKLDQPKYWKNHRCASIRDLVIKKIFITVIALANFAALGYAFYFVVSYCTIPEQALIVSPFVAGALAALSQLKFPTLGISSTNYTNYTNPFSMIGRGLAYLFFGPLLYGISKIDWTPYHDAFLAKNITKELKQEIKSDEDFELVISAYGHSIKNLVKYGFIAPQHKDELEEIYEKFIPLKKEIDFYKNEESRTSIKNEPTALISTPEDDDKDDKTENEIVIENIPKSTSPISGDESQDLKDARAEMGKLREQWVKLQDIFKESLPKPKTPKYDFSKSCTSTGACFRQLCCFGAPTESVKGLKF